MTKEQPTLEQLKDAITALAELALEQPDVDAKARANQTLSIARIVSDMADDRLKAKVVNAESGDVIALIYDEALSVEQAENLKEQGARIWPDNEIVVLSGGVDVELQRVSEAIG